jgi:transcriptional regulator with XRE-family HTH domain
VIAASDGSVFAAEDSLMAGIGGRLRAIRRQRGLSLQEVERCSRSIARERRDSSFEVSASWLARLERDGDELTVNKLICLAEIYSIPFDQLVRPIYPGNAERQNPDQPSSANGTELPTEGLRKVPGNVSPSTEPLPRLPPNETTLLSEKNGPSPRRYLRAIIGQLDLTLAPMIPPGSIVQIDPRTPEISSKRDWTHEFQRPIYFLRAPEG